MLAQTNSTCKRTIRSILSVLTAETAVYTAVIPESLSYEYALTRRKKLLNQIVCAEKKKYQVCVARDTWSRFGDSIEAKQVLRRNKNSGGIRFLQTLRLPAIHALIGMDAYGHSVTTQANTFITSPAVCTGAYGEIYSRNALDSFCRQSYNGQQFNHVGRGNWYEAEWYF